MATTSFDPLATARDLEAAGIEHHHAAAIATGMRKAAVADRDQLASKTDIRWIPTFEASMSYPTALISTVASTLDGVVPIDFRIGTYTRFKWTTRARDGMTRPEIGRRDNPRRQRIGARR